MLTDDQDVIRFRIGQVIRPHGVHGALLVRLDEPDRYVSSPSKAYLVKGSGEFVRITVLGFRPHKQGVLLETREITSRTDAQTFRDAVVFVSDDEALTLRDGEYFVRDLIHCEVWVKGPSRSHVMGEVTTVWSLPHQDILLVCTDKQREIPIPFIPPFVLKVDIKQKRIIVALPSGYLDIYR